MIKSLTQIERTLLVVFAVFSLLYISLIPTIKMVPGLHVIKDIPDVSLAALALIGVAGIRGKLLFVTYVLCALAGLALDLPLAFSFSLGLAIFMLGHIGYIVTFSRDFQWKNRRLWLVILLAAYAIVMGMVMTPFLGGLLLPVYAYMAVITLMCIFATMRNSPDFLVIVGALLFLVSDSALAINKFMFPVPGESYIVMVTYYAAQLLIILGFLRRRPA
jgi:uncharacterized membrane protein YhhN